MQSRKPSSKIGESILSKADVGLFFFKEDMFKGYSDTNLSEIINMDLLRTDVEKKDSTVTKRTRDCAAFIKMLCTIPFTRSQQKLMFKDSTFFDYIIREKMKKYVKPTNSWTNTTYKFFIDGHVLGFNCTSWGTEETAIIATLK